MGRYAKVIRVKTCLTPYMHDPIVRPSRLTYPVKLCRTLLNFLNILLAGKTIGRCLSSLGGKYWCYVSSTSSCPDKKQFSRNQLYWSAQACLNEGGQETAAPGNGGQDNVQPIKGLNFMCNSRLER